MVIAKPVKEANKFYKLTYLLRTYTAEGNLRLLPLTAHHVATAHEEREFLLTVEGELAAFVAGGTPPLIYWTLDPCPGSKSIDLI